MINVKLVNLFTVCVITALVIFPSLTVFGLVWDKHLEFVEMQHNIATYSQTFDNECSASFITTSSVIDNNFSNLYANPDEINLNFSDKYQSYNLWRWFVLFVPFCIGTVIYFYDRYLVHRAHVFQQQVEMLEKLWQQSLEQ